jgi:DNA-binding response OmpR family regulator
VKPSIFVVEDDPDISRLVRHHLEGAGFSVKLFPTGNLVIAESERQRPALFILDIMVPGKDGLELCRQIRQTSSLASIPVIFLTAKSGEADRILGLELGADDYIPKPFSPRELVARVKAVLRRFERPL